MARLLARLRAAPKLAATEGNFGPSMSLSFVELHSGESCRRVDSDNHVDQGVERGVGPRACTPGLRGRATKCLKGRWLRGRSAPSPIPTTPSQRRDGVVGIGDGDSG